MSNIRIISRKALEGNDRYEYCPFCYKELKSENKDIKEFLQPLWCVLTADHEEGRRDIITKHWECPRCKNKNITTNDFVEAYVEI